MRQKTPRLGVVGEAKVNSAKAISVCSVGCSRVTLVLFRTRRRVESSRLKEGVRRRVRKSRQKEAAGAADAGPMQIEWSEAAGLMLGGVVKALE